MATFKAPQQLPQDLLLISELVDTEQYQPVIPTSTENGTDDIASSGGESEEEIEKDLTRLQDEEENEGAVFMPSKSSSGSESDSSSSESESGVELQTQASKGKVSAQDDDQDEGMAPGATAYFQTKNEIADAPIITPKLEEVGMEEVLEKVGEVLSVIGDTAIVRSLSSDFVNHGSERALDSDTLLVFEDRKVMGYIYETFGPTSQPLYQIKFNQERPLDPEKVQVGREVFHVPRRSHFIFVDLLKQSKGSDASNVHDEEPGEDEMEFSDDEAEAAHRIRLKYKRGRERSNSVLSSRHSTPAPSQMRDQDMMIESVSNKSAFDEHGPYDLDYGAGSSRLTPKPYADPYSDTYSPSLADYNARMEEFSERPNTPKDKSPPHLSTGRGRGRGRSRGRGRGRGNRFNSHSRGSFGDRQSHPTGIPSADTETYDPRLPQESLPIPFSQTQSSHFSPSIDPSWNYPDPSFGQSQNRQFHIFSNQQVPYASPSTFVQPHINPRFASAFGFQLPPSVNLPTAAPIPQDQGLTEQWMIPTTDPSESEFKEPSS